MASTNTSISRVPGSIALAGLAEEELIPLNAVRNLPSVKHSGRGGKRPDPATIHRWASRGVRAPGGQLVRLETVPLGGKRMTTRAAVGRFIAALNATGSAPLREADAVRLAHEQAAAELDAAGI